ncbi:MAG: SDR family NAD(P)-dependent oxidoreductase [Phycisphaerae bacterium]|nr:SDR family NAD(P)-dependent oxidoreductase [Phycisphaerae bacterium]
MSAATSRPATDRPAAPPPVTTTKPAINLPARHILIVGATSSIARALALRLARRGCNLVVAGRDDDEIVRLASDLALRSRAAVHPMHLDAANFGAHAPAIERAEALLGGRLDGVVLAQGVMHPHEETARDPALVLEMVHANYASVVSLASACADRLPDRTGFLCVVSSVAGDRGRASNPVYGSTKAAANAYLDGLRAGLFPRGVAVVCVRPGFVDTAMTWGLPGMFLVASPERVARDIDRAILRRRAVAYTPWFWRWIMLIIRVMPAWLFNRLRP